ncbi:hypothetical protein D9758_007192 [Tetrapyrgos nigripes]|uniref:ATP-dependent DNA ligase family profile domain-containing protein n=1 Tax=Tetrapyrgos nigripes TaxID=182062 RepID=A0A8H5D3G3_9AGAR|nr:hypothetical protein D9758_007192 [Tetrapyrgos nigripes]
MSQSDRLKDIPFSFFAALPREISRTIRRTPVNSKREQRHLALEVFKNWKTRLYDEFSPLPPDTSRILFQLLFPKEDTARKYQMQEPALSSELMKCFGINDSRLKDWSKEGHSGCLGEELRQVLSNASSDPDETSSLTLGDVDKLLGELALLSPWSNSSKIRQDLSRPRRSRQEIIKSLFRPLPPMDAAVMTQIILKDLDAFLYPLPTLSTTEALRCYNSLSVKKLTMEEAMRAWDPMTLMLRSFRLHNSLDEAALAFEHNVLATAPRIGIQVQMPKSEKGRSPLHALKLFRTPDLIWAETKYDGERAQIHIEIVEGEEPRLNILSKSKRNSTLDRRAVHPIIVQCLGLHSSRPKIKKNAILDAEMCAFIGDRIDAESWRIGGLVEATAAGIRAKQTGKRKRRHSSGQYSKPSETRHLGLVFFDVLLVDDKSLITAPYWERRNILEELIIPKPGLVLLSTRWPLTIDGQSEASELSQSYQDYFPDDCTVTALANIFAERTALCYEEGLVLKASRSTYNDFRAPWVKLKRDYIPGLGDSIDLILLGAVWDKERAAELAVPTSTYTTFYIGVWQNPDEIERDPSVLPNFHIYCTSSYGQSRADLETLNFLIKSKTPIAYTKNRMVKGLPYTYTIYEGLSDPAVLLAEPVVVEVLGDRFVKAESKEPYQPRHPRIAKWFRSFERSWSDTVPREELERIAIKALGVEENMLVQDEFDQWASGLGWTLSKPKAPALSAEKQAERKRKREKEVEKMLVVMSGLDKRKIKRVKLTRETWEGATLSDIPLVGPMERYDGLRDQASRPVSGSPAVPDSRSSNMASDSTRAPLRISTNIQHATREESPDVNAATKLPPTPDTGHRHPKKMGSRKASSPVRSLKPMSLDKHSSKTAAMDDYPLYEQNCAFFKNAVIWYSGGGNAPWKTVIRQSSTRVSAIEAVLSGCGWRCSQTQALNSNPQCDWSRGVLVFDLDNEYGQAQREHALSLIRARSRVPFSVRKPIWFFNSLPCSCCKNRPKDFDDDDDDGNYNPYPPGHPGNPIQPGSVGSFGQPGQTQHQPQQRDLMYNPQTGNHVNEHARQPSPTSNMAYPPMPQPTHYGPETGYGRSPPGHSGHGHAYGAGENSADIPMALKPGGN